MTLSQASVERFSQASVERFWTLAKDREVDFLGTVPSDRMFIWFERSTRPRSTTIDRRTVSFYYKSQGHHWLVYAVGDHTYPTWKKVEIQPNVLPEPGSLREIGAADFVAITTMDPTAIFFAQPDARMPENTGTFVLSDQVNIEQFPVFSKIHDEEAEKSNGEPAEEIPNDCHVRSGMKVKVLKTQLTALAPVKSSSEPYLLLHKDDVVEVESVRRRGPQLVCYYEVEPGLIANLDFLPLEDVEPVPTPKKAVKKSSLTQESFPVNLARSQRPNGSRICRRVQPMTTLKRVLFGVLCVLALGTFIFGGDLWSYLGTATSEVRDAARSNVPVEFEIERAKNMVADLVPEIKKNMDTIAREEVALERLDKQIAALGGRMGDAKGEMLTLEADLSNDIGAPRFTYCGKTYTRGQVEADLASRFERYQVDEATLAAQEQMKTVREQSLATAKEKLQAYLGQKRQLEVQLEQLGARLKMIDLAKTTSEFNFDADSLGEAKELVAELQARLDVEERMMAQHSNMANDVVLADADVDGSQEITHKVAEYFEETPEPIELVGTTPVE